LEAAEARVEELQAEHERVAGRYQELVGAIASAPASEIENLVRQRREARETYEALGAVLMEARNAAEKAAQAFARARLPEIRTEKAAAMSEVRGKVREALTPLREIAERVATLENEAAGLNLPDGVMYRPDSSLMSTEGVLRSATEEALYGRVGTIAVVIERDFLFQDPPPGLERDQYTTGRTIHVPAGTAEMLVRQGYASFSTL
jgi:hypothetical protein